MSRRGLQLLLTMLGLGAVTFGALTAVLGAVSVEDVVTAPASLDSELRYYAVWYVAAGVLVLRAVRRVEAERTLIRIVFAALFAGGSVRLLSIAAVGTPHAVYLWLMGAELALPLVIVPWQAAVARRAGRTGNDG
jgi:hypothetical protein